MNENYQAIASNFNISILTTVYRHTNDTRTLSRFFNPLFSYSSIDSYFQNRKVENRIKILQKYQE